MVYTTLLHFTDSHLYGDREHLLKGISPMANYSAVLDLAHRNMPEVDAVILGGDMAQDESAEAYRHVAEPLNRWQVPVMISPGNHADLPTLYRVLVPALESGPGYSVDLALGGWRLLTISTHQVGSVPGWISEEELQRLASLLDAAVDQHVLVALHHPPLLVGSRWMDAIGLKNRDALWQLLENYPQVRLLLNGHIHQAFDGVHQGVRVLGSPATSVQFIPGEDDFALDGVSPGYRWLKLYDNGDLETGIERVEGMIPPDLMNDDPY